MQHAGILAHSVPGAALCFGHFCETAMAELGEHEHPDVTMDCIAMGRSMPAWEDGDHDAVRAVLASSAARLAAAGCDFFVCPDNTAHLALERDGADLALPGLHIAEAVARHAAAAGYRRVGILGTRWTMEADLYPRVLAAHGISAGVPDAASRDRIQELTFGELTHGLFTDAARAEFVAVIRGLEAAGCEAVALVCTEFPLLVSPAQSPIPTLESTTLAAEAAVGVALGRDPLPTWRGGPPDGAAA
ncbi:aspartate racemase [Murinocardiopsis flavida]|uniref:Aspartate racemase n=1 Tax=Murinocardiopsis flavida TaxID=645275 RepID=A0A2P8CJ96_9ACTN|nr:amino acid racemase [Murinocardiopsis flavida]PSK85037.1 aspartate racemase [Murinocardiopsis flavida]